MNPGIYFKYYLMVSLLSISLLACNSSDTKTGNESTGIEKNIVEVISTGMQFEMPAELQPGWTTFNYINKSNETHFFIFEKMPDGITIANYENELVPPFKKVFELLLKDSVNEAMKEYEKIPGWWQNVKLGGGVGLISPGSTAESTINLSPGIYVMECYVRMPNGMPHAFYGMIKEIRVTGEPNNNLMPNADHKISISSESGISFTDSIKAGEYQFAVKFNDQKTL